MTTAHAFIPLRRTAGAPLWARIDVADMESVLDHTWSALVMRHTTYARTSVGLPDGRRSSLYLHQVIMMTTGVDHINGNGLDNSRRNLRPATPAQNAVNRAPVVGTSSRHRGVGWHRRKRCWQAYITVDRKSKHLGYFDSEMAAALAYNRAALAAWGEWARLNQVHEDQPPSTNEPLEALVLVATQLGPSRPELAPDLQELGFGGGPS